MMVRQLKFQLEDFNFNVMNRDEGTVASNVDDDIGLETSESRG
jgi:hypothetical protein